MTAVLAYLNLKGGVGKTTLAANITRAMIDVRRTKILLIDLDAQCNLSQLFLDEENFDGTGNMQNVYECFCPTGHATFVPGPGDLKRQIASNNAGSSIDLIFGSFEVLRLQYSGSTLQRELARSNFRRFMEIAREEYDLIVLDTNPGNPFAIQCAVDNASFLVMPVTADAFSLRGLHLVRDVLAEKFPWVQDPDRCRIIVNKAENSATYSRRYNCFLAWIEKSLPTLMPSLLHQKIKSSGFLVQAPEKKGFLLDQAARGGNVRHREKLLKDLTAAATEILSYVNAVPHPIPRQVRPATLQREIVPHTNAGSQTSAIDTGKLLPTPAVEQRSMSSAATPTAPAHQSRLERPKI